MRLGICTAIENAPILRAAHCDYIELSVAGDLLPDVPDAEWNEKRAAIEAMVSDYMPVRAFNSFIRRGKITGTDVDTDYLRRYVRTALQRAAIVGGETVVFGSGGARNIPDGFDRSTAQKQMRDFLILCADAAEETGVTVVIEPLRKAESNILNTVSEAVAYAAPLNRNGLRVLGDTYHMEAENEPLEQLIEFAEPLKHMHTADTDRNPPGTGIYDHAALFATLKKANYDGKLSIECNWSDLPTQAAAAIAHLRRFL